jgi:antitoxin component of MazEF toxin-antitoxin module
LNQKYKVKRKLQEQSGSYFVVLPRMWIEALGLKEGDLMAIEFNGSVRIDPARKQEVVQNAERK